MHLQKTYKPRSQSNEIPKEQRQHERIKVSLNAWAVFESEAQVSVTTENISETGIGILSPVLALPRTNCWVKLAIPIKGQPEKVFDILAEVVHGYYSHKNKLFKTGIRFVQPQPGLIEMLKASNK